MNLRSIARRVLVALPLLLLVAWILPLASGARTLIYRDVLVTHLPLRAAVGAALRAGEMPLLDPFRAGGQPLLGNANAGVLYPDSLLLAVADPLWVLNAHFWIHWLIAPFAMAWLGRAWRLGRRAAWAAGVTYAFGGFFLSLMNLHNLVAGAALAPAFVAACLRMNEARPSTDSRTATRASRRWPVAAVLWCLLVTAGGPTFALGALLLAAGAMVFQSAETSQERTIRQLARPVGTLGLALAAGTAMAAPLVIETLRVLPFAYRSHWSQTEAANLAQSWDPRSLVEWLVPTAFGEPGMRFWGVEFSGGDPPLLFATSPGWIALALVCVAGLPSRRTWRGAIGWSWAAIALGVVLALGSHNPLVRAVVEWTGQPPFRYPVKAWLLSAIGLSLLAGCGAERLLAGSGVRRLRFALTGALGATLVLAWEIVRRAPWLVERLREALPAGRSADAELARLAGSQFFLVLSLALAVFVAWRAGRRDAAGSTSRGGGLALPALLTIHAGSQLLLLAPLLATDESTPYREAPPILAHLPVEASIVHQASSGALGARAVKPRWREEPMAALMAARFAEAPRWAGTSWGRHYALDPGPDGLDSVYSVLARDAGTVLDDPSRLRLAQTWGVDRLVISRPFDRALEERFGLLEVATLNDAADGTLRIYSMVDSVPDLRFVGETVPSASLDVALGLLTASDAAPHHRAVVPAAAGLEFDGPPGTIEAARERPTAITARVDSPSGGLLVAQRAWLAPWRATVDGDPVETVVADIQQLGVPVPPGRHEVRLVYERSPVVFAFAVSLLAGLMTAGAALRRPTQENPS